MGVTVVILADSGGCGLSFHRSLGKTSTGQGDESRNSEIQCRARWYGVSGCLGAHEFMHLGTDGL